MSNLTHRLLFLSAGCMFLMPLWIQWNGIGRALWALYALYGQKPLESQQREIYSKNRIRRNSSILFIQRSSNWLIHVQLGRKQLRKPRTKLDWSWFGMMITEWTISQRQTNISWLYVWKLYVFQAEWARTEIEKTDFIIGIFYLFRLRPSALPAFIIQCQWPYVLCLFWTSCVILVIQAFAKMSGR